SLVGTTDVDDATAPADVHATAADVRYLWDELAARWPDHPAARDPRRAVSRVFAGLRPLARGNPRRPWDNRREARLVAEGGKYSTARAYAEHALDRVVGDLRLRVAPCTTRTALLPGRTDPTIAAARARWSEKDPAVAPGPFAPARADVEVAMELQFARTVA